MTTALDEHMLIVAVNIAAQELLDIATDIPAGYGTSSLVALTKREVEQAAGALHESKAATLDDVRRLATFETDSGHDCEAQYIQRAILRLATGMIYPKAVCCFIYPEWTVEVKWFDVIYYIDEPMRRIVGFHLVQYGLVTDVGCLRATARTINEFWTPQEILTGWERADYAKEIREVAQEGPDGDRWPRGFVDVERQ